MNLRRKSKSKSKSKRKISLNKLKNKWKNLSPRNKKLMKLIIASIIASGGLYYYNRRRGGRPIADEPNVFPFDLGDLDLDRRETEKGNSEPFIKMIGAPPPTRHQPPYPHTTRKPFNLSLAPIPPPKPRVRPIPPPKKWKDPALITASIRKPFGQKLTSTDESFFTAQSRNPENQKKNRNRSARRRARSLVKKNLNLGKSVERKKLERKKYKTKKK